MTNVLVREGGAIFRALCATYIRNMGIVLVLIGRAYDYQTVFTIADAFMTAMATVE